jgi:hypothetical protein
LKLTKTRETRVIHREVRRLLNLGAGNCDKESGRRKSEGQFRRLRAQPQSGIAKAEKQKQEMTGSESERMSSGGR